ncbi:MAG: nitroreductase family protein [Proteobacteria bacterium]|nr:nitroreductase family protein [Pseudomonadota bacterium]
MSETEAIDAPALGRRELYDNLMSVVRNRITTRQFDPDFQVPEEHFELILEAARHGPSGANAQPWHYIIVRDPAVKRQIADYFVAEARFRAKKKMKFPTPNYAGLATAPGLIVVASDFRYVSAFPVLKDDESDLNRMYKENAERILLQSVAASTMSAHLAATALGYNVWWVTAIGQQKAQEAMKPLLGIPDELSVLDIFCFGPPLKPPYKRWKKELGEIMNWDVFNPDNFITDEELETWIREKRHKVMYRDADNVD